MRSRMAGRAGTEEVPDVPRAPEKVTGVSRAGSLGPEVSSEPLGSHFPPSGSQFPGKGSRGFKRATFRTPAKAFPASRERVSPDDAVTLPGDGESFPDDPASL